MPVCPNCQADNPEGGRFCERCGQRLRRRPTWVVPAIAAVAVGVLAGTAVAVLALRGDGPEQESRASRSSPGSAPSPSPSPTATGPVELEASFPEFVIGSRVNFWVNPGPSRDDTCAVNLFRFQGIGKARGAFRSDCSDWDSPGYDLYFFEVIVHNTSEESFTLRLERLSLVDRNGKEHQPVNLKARALFPEFFLGKKERIRSDEEIQRWVTFRANSDFVPKELHLRDGQERLIIVFDGKLVRNAPG
jgi:hypothetical protein